MNKIIFTILMCSLSALAVNYNVPYAGSIPTIDGVIGVGEWDDALSVNVSYADFVTNGSGTSITGTTPTAGDLSGVYYFKWDTENLYMAFDVTDDILMWRNTYPGPYNGQDTVQLCFNPYNDSAAVFETDAWIFDITAETVDMAGPDIYRHTGAFNSDPNIVKAVLDDVSDNYVIETVIAWSDIKSDMTALPGDIHGVGLMQLDFDGSSVDSLLCDFGNGSNFISQPDQWNTMTLVGADGCGSQGRYAGDINADCYVDLIDYSLIASQWLGCTDPADPDCSL